MDGRREDGCLAHVGRHTGPHAHRRDGWDLAHPADDPYSASGPWRGAWHHPQASQDSWQHSRSPDPAGASLEPLVKEFAEAVQSLKELMHSRGSETGGQREVSAAAQQTPPPTPNADPQHTQYSGGGIPLPPPEVAPPAPREQPTPTWAAFPAQRPPDASKVKPEWSAETRAEARTETRDHGHTERGSPSSRGSRGGKPRDRRDRRDRRDQTSDRGDERGNRRDDALSGLNAVPVTVVTTTITKLTGAAVTTAMILIIVTDTATPTTTTPGSIVKLAATAAVNVAVAACALSMKGASPSTIMITTTNGPAVTATTALRIATYTTGATVPATTIRILATIPLIATTSVGTATPYMVRALDVAVPCARKDSRHEAGRNPTTALWIPIRLAGLSGHLRP